MEAHPDFPGLLLRRGRLARGWSQEGLCRGICAVSYLSKIENGTAAPSGEVLDLLFGRLGMSWHGGEAARQAAALAAELYEAVTEMDTPRQRRLFAELDAHRVEYTNGPQLLEFALLELYRGEPAAPALPLEEFAAVMTPRQRALWLLAGPRREEALPLAPSPFAWATVGQADFRAGRYALALQRLQRGFALAAEECLVHVMLYCQLFMGNCYSNLNQYESMLRHYRRAMRLAEVVADISAPRDIRYNIAATQIELGRYEEAYEYFRRLEAPNVMALHKLAVCCEKLGHPGEALAALDRTAGAPPAVGIAPALARQVCQVVRCRLENPAYLQDPAYGALLLDCFAQLRTVQPHGYAAFHLPWVEEWYIANRQYKQAWALLRDFPDYSARNGFNGDFSL